LTRVLVTGATGFIGAHAVRGLAAAGFQVVALLRPGHVPQGSVEAAYAADLTDRRALAAALDGVEVVVHLAGRAHVMKESATDPIAAFRAVNVAGTRALLAEADAVRHVILASSVKAVGESTADHAWSSGSVPRPVTAYGVSKREAEIAVEQWSARTGRAATILRLPLVYGAGVKGNMYRLMKFVDSGMPLPLGAVRNRRSLLFVGNLVDALCALAAQPAAGCRTFFAADGQDLSSPELIRLLATALGRRARMIPVPPAWFLAAGRLGDRLAPVLPLPLSSAAVSRLLGSLQVDAAPLHAVAGVPRYSPADGVEVMVRWYQGQQ
jgi:nucleoside-diphosphate-sugar epimerase